MRLLISCFVAVLLFQSSAMAKDDDFLNLDLSELVNIKVTSVSKTEQTLFEAPAAIYVLTNEDIKRSGVKSIPDALRLVPGMDVAQVSSNDWAVSGRGFNSRFANKLLVLIDGRSIYTPTFGGVFWDVQQVLFDDVDRIEVIRGPGGSVWGANAVNGVINIITKKASETQSTFIRGGGGSELQGLFEARAGEQISEDTHVRVYGKYLSHDSSEFSDGSDVGDEWDHAQAGFRLDSQLSEHDSFTIHGDIYDFNNDDYTVSPIPRPPFSTAGAVDEDALGVNVLARWSHQLSEDSSFDFQFYYDHVDRESTTIEKDRDTFDVDFQHQFAWGDANLFTWGLNYRVFHDDLGDQLIVFDPRSDYYHLVDGFIQNEFSFLDDQLKLIIGTKVGHNDFTGTEVQPTARALYKVSDKNSVWLAFSRAVRTPDRALDGINIPFLFAPLPDGSITQVTTVGNGSLDVEELFAYEAGYRGQLESNLFVDVALFYNRHEDLVGSVTQEPVFTTTPIPSILTESILDNGIDSDSWGVEVALDWKAMAWWRLVGSYSFYRQSIDIPDGFVNVTGNSLHVTPENKFSIRSHIDLPHDVSCDTVLRYADNVRNFDISNYMELDQRFAWKPNQHLEFAIVGRNLLDKRHPEFLDSNIAATQFEIERSIYGEVTVEF